MTTEWPLTVPVVLMRRVGGGVDEYGDPLPERFSEENVMVFGVAVGGDEPVTATRPERVRHDLTVYAPTSLQVGARDRIRHRGEVFEVDGPPGDWDENPWWSPGLAQIRCNRLEG